jgi:hypothetical protein
LQPSALGLAFLPRRRISEFLDHLPVAAHLDAAFERHEVLA